ncbi:MAG TPA: hypothetical protein VLI92_02685 [Candidatus Saccharimonadales bacterium]|nr:hypothetical protein [Candidatus Saccharimonadales bacterium]
MFDKLKDINNLRKVQGELKKEAEQIFVNGEKRDNVVLIRGDKHIEKLVINGVENKEIKDLINDTMKDVDKKLEKVSRSHLSDLGIGL